MPPEAELGDSEVVQVVRDGYDAVAENYLSYAGQAEGHPRHSWLDELLARLAPASRILELGCGPGVPTALRVVSAGHRLVGVDLSPRQIELARRHAPDAEFINTDMLKLSFEASSFDAVVAFYSIIHVPRRHYAALFERIHHWLRPDGWLLASFGTGNSSGWLEEDLLGLGAANWTNSYDPATTERLLLDAHLLPKKAIELTQDEPTGPERWFYVLARNSRND